MQVPGRSYCFHPIYINSLTQMTKGQRGAPGNPTRPSSKGKKAIICKLLTIFQEHSNCHSLPLISHMTQEVKQPADTQVSFLDYCSIWMCQPRLGPAAKPHRPAHKALAAAMLVAAPAGLELQGSSFLVFCPIHQTNFPWQGIKYTNYFCPRVFHPLQLQCLDNCCHYICRAGVLEKIPETPDTITL